MDKRKISINKSKIAVSITIGIMSFMMIYVMLIQINLVNYDKRGEVEFLRETELKELLANYKEKYNETEQQLIDTKAKIEEYKREDKSEEDAVALLAEEVKQANMLLGNTKVKGEGIVITMENNIRYDERESSIIKSADIISLINELKLAGAEAISVNNERIVAKSDVFDVGNFVCINGQRTSSPYEIKAIGDRKHLEAALTIKEGFIDTYTNNDYIINIESYEEITIDKYEGEMTLNYAKNNINTKK